MKLKSYTYLSVLSLCVLTTVLTGQDLKYPSVIASAGTVSTTGSISLEWTLGETFVQNFKTQNDWYTEGYHQPLLIVSPGSGIDRQAFDIRIFPNPAVQRLFVTIKSAIAEPVILRLTDLAGRSILYTEAATSADQIELSMAHIPQGMYLLTVVNQRGIQFGTFKVIKQ